MPQNEPSIPTFELTEASDPVSDGQRAQILKEPQFGLHFTDHMALVEWSQERGWHNARVQPLGPLQMHPAAGVLHYGQEVFEGLKIYRHQDDRLFAFRPEMNAARFRRSAKRLALPEVPTELFLEAIDTLATVDADWVPPGSGPSLYLRPYLIATEPFLGVRPAGHALFGVIASPAGDYFSDPSEGVSLWLSTEHARAGRGGTGAAKCGGNYAASLIAQDEARRHGCQQVLFTDAETNTWVEEAGSMNICFLFENDRLVTPPTAGTILEGVTRDSILKLAARNGYSVEERPIGIEEWETTASDGSLREVFATGTAAVITPIQSLVTDRTTIQTPVRGLGPVAGALREELIGIQVGSVPDSFDWLHEVSAGVNAADQPIQSPSPPGP